LISSYNAERPAPGPANFRAVLTKRLRLQGLIVFDWADRIPEAIRELGTWHRTGQLKIREDVRAGGIDAFPETLNLLYTGGNFGKLVLKV
jgi:NADPH-dependent curcumin reductase CurA